MHRYDASERRDSGGKASVLTAGSIRLTLLKRPKGRAIRLRDLSHPMRKGVSGLAHFDPDTTWRLDARFEAYVRAKSISILDVTGVEDDKPSPGALVFAVGGREYRLDAVPDNDTTRVTWFDSLTTTRKNSAPKSARLGGA
ncbi:MAG: DUF1684 domain-containing protein [Gemmatimonadaceae bacterium]